MTRLDVLKRGERGREVNEINSMSSTLSSLSSFDSLSRLDVRFLRPRILIDYSNPKDHRFHYGLIDFPIYRHHSGYEYIEVYNPSLPKLNNLHKIYISFVGRTVCQLAVELRISCLGPSLDPHTALLKEKGTFLLNGARCIRFTPPTLKGERGEEEGNIDFVNPLLSCIVCPENRPERVSPIDTLGDPSHKIDNGIEVYKSLSLDKIGYLSKPIHEPTKYLLTKEEIPRHRRQGSRNSSSQEEGEGR